MRSASKNKKSFMNFKIVRPIWFQSSALLHYGDEDISWIMNIMNIMIFGEYVVGMCGCQSRRCQQLTYSNILSLLMFFFLHRCLLESMHATEAIQFDEWQRRRMVWRRSNDNSATFFAKYSRWLGYNSLVRQEIARTNDEIKFSKMAHPRIRASNMLLLTCV